VILADVNVLASAFRTDAAAHKVCRSWLERLLRKGEYFGVSLQVLAAVVRITSNGRIFDPPSEVSEALDFCQALIGHPQAITVQPGSGHWEIFCQLCRAGGARGNLISDAWFAALAVENACEWITLDRDFARFPGLKWSMPSLQSS
jgi:toxin-antitoxin system PIN domain toxin